MFCFSVICSCGLGCGWRIKWLPRHSTHTPRPPSLAAPHESCIHKNIHTYVLRDRMAPQAAREAATIEKWQQRSRRWWQERWNEPAKETEFMESTVPASSVVLYTSIVPVSPGIPATTNKTAAARKRVNPIARNLDKITIPPYRIANRANEQTQHPPPPGGPNQIQNKPYVLLAHPTRRPPPREM